jgi:hypothetical protein
VAYQAKAGEISDFDVDALQSTAEQVLQDHDDPAFRAINAFATDYQLCRYDVDRLAEIGEALRHVVEIESRPVPPGQERADING